MEDITKTERAEYEAYVAACLAAPDEAWYDEQGNWTSAYRMPLPSRFAGRASNEPRIQARRRDVDVLRQVIRTARAAERRARQHARIGEALRTYLASPDAPWPTFEVPDAYLREHTADIPLAADARATRARVRREHIAARLQEIAPLLLVLWRQGDLNDVLAVRIIADHVLGPLVGPAADTALCQSPECPCGWKWRGLHPPDDVTARQAALLATLPPGSTVGDLRVGISHLDVERNQKVTSVWIATVRVPDGPLLLERAIKL